MYRLPFVTILIASSAASAEPDHYVAGGVMFGAAEPVYDGYNVMAAADAGYRLTPLLWAHAGAAYGPSIDRFGAHQPNGGHNELARGGIEVRWCASIVCGIAGADLGVQHGSWTTTQYQVGMETLSDTALVAIPRVGFDVGGDALRLRATFEADTSLVSDETTDEPNGKRIFGFELAAGVAYLW